MSTFWNKKRYSKHFKMIKMKEKEDMRFTMPCNKPFDNLQYHCNERVFYLFWKFMGVTNKIKRWILCMRIYCFEKIILVLRHLHLSKQTIKFISIVKQSYKLHGQVNKYIPYYPAYWRTPFKGECAFIRITAHCALIKIKFQNETVSKLNS